MRIRPIQSICREGPAIVDVPVRFTTAEPDPFNSSVVDVSDEAGVSVISSPLNQLGYQGLGSLGQVTLSIAPSHKLTVTPNSFPWRVASTGEAAHDSLVPAYLESRQKGLAAARSHAKFSKDSAGWFESLDHEPVLSVRMTHKCDHDCSTYINRACGHHFCAVCNGHVDPSTKNVARGETPVVGCNRQLQDRNKYDIWFQEFGPNARFSFYQPVQ